MAYPPSVPTGARINTTPQVDLHPADHVAIHAALTDILNELGSNPSGDSADLTARFNVQNPVGIITPYAGATAPTGWSLCDGSAVSRSTYPGLFSLIGETYGAGDGATTFNLPNLQNRFVAGKGPVAWSNAVGETGGSKDAVAVQHEHTTGNHQHNVSVTTTNSGAHEHDEGGYSNTANTGFLYRQGAGADGWETLNGSGSITKSYTYPQVQAAGSAHSHTSSGTTNNQTGTITTITQTPNASGTDANLPPYITLNYIIRLT